MNRFNHLRIRPNSDSLELRPSGAPGAPAPADPEEYPYADLMIAIYYGQETMADAEMRGEYKRTAAAHGVAVFTDMILHFLDPLCQPEREVYFHEGDIGAPIRLEPGPRDVTGAYLCITDREGEIIEEGPMACPDGEWTYEPQDPDREGWDEVLVFILAAGAHQVNA